MVHRRVWVNLRLYEKPLEVLVSPKYPRFMPGPYFMSGPMPAIRYFLLSKQKLTISFFYMKLLNMRV